MTSFYIEITNNLLKDGHRKRMGSAVWEFMWLLDKITSIDEEGVGYVLGNKTITLTQIAKDMETAASTTSDNLQKLHEYGYINVINNGHGLIISVNKAKKRFKREVGREFGKDDTRIRKTPYQNEPFPNSYYIDNNKDNNNRHIPDSRPATQKRVSLEKATLIQRLGYHLEDTLGTTIVNWGKQAEAVKKMTQAGYTEEQIMKTITFMATKDDFFKDKGFDLMTVANQIGRYKAQASKRKEAHAAD